MIIGICQIDILIFEANSLKEKRHVLKSIIERLKSRFNISVSEVDYHELWNRASVGISVVSNEKIYCEMVIDKVIKFIDNDERVEIVSSNKEIL